MIDRQQPAPKVEPPTLAFVTVADFEAWVAEHREDQAETRARRIAKSVEMLANPST